MSTPASRQDDQRDAVTGLPAQQRRMLVEVLADGSVGLSRGKFVEFLPDVEAISQRRHSPFATALVFCVMLLVLAVVAWMMVFQVQEVATAPGMVRPAGKVKVINHPDGGRIAEIFVKDGDRVNEGDELLRLDPDQVREEIAKAQAAWANAGTEVIRLQAEAAGTKPVFDNTFAARPDLVAAQQRLYDARQAELKTHQAQADAVIAQQRSKIENLQAKIDYTSKSVAVLRDQVRKLRTLAGQGYFPELQWQNTQRQFIEQEGNLQGAKIDLDQAQKGLNEATEKRAAVDQEWRSQVLKRLGDSIAERDRAAGIMQQQSNDLRNLSIRSPTKGIVQGLRFNTVGQSIKPGETICNVVPVDDSLMIETRVSNDDIGELKIGQTATVKIQTYNWMRYGTIEGVVDQISADATVDDKTNQPYFTVTVRTDRDYVLRDGVKYPVLPGMTATVDMKIGQRSIISYFVDRVTGTLQSSFREH